GHGDSGAAAATRSAGREAIARTWHALSRVVRARSLHPALAGARQKRGIENILRSEFGLKAMGKTELPNGLIETGHVDGAIAERPPLGSSDVLLWRAAGVCAPLRCSAQHRGEPRRRPLLPEP